jgi:hypothetical protein
VKINNSKVEFKNIYKNYNIIKNESSTYEDEEEENYLRCE